MKLIGISGKAKSGKDEASDILCISYGFHKISFATKIKELVEKYYGVDREFLYDNKTKESRQILQGVGQSVRNELTNIKTIFETEVVIGLSTYPVWVENIAVKYFDVELAYITTKRKYRKYVKTILDGTLFMWTDLLREFVKVSVGVDKNIWINYLLSDLDNNLVYVISDVRYLNEKESIEKLGGKVIRIHRPKNPGIEAGSDHESEMALDDVIMWDAFVMNDFLTDWKHRLEIALRNVLVKFNRKGFFKQEDFNASRISIV